MTDDRHPAVKPRRPEPLKNPSFELAPKIPIRVHLYARINIKSTIKEGWGYESTVTVEAACDESQTDQAEDIILAETGILNRICRVEAEREIAVRNRSGKSGSEAIELVDEAKEVTP